MKDRRQKGNNYGAHTTTLVAAGTHVKGEICFCGDLEIEGKVTGNIIAEDESKARVRILPAGEVRGEVYAPTVVVNGFVEGNLFVSEHVELASKAVVEGNVHYQMIEVEKGARVNGSFVHDAAKAAEARAEAIDGSASGGPRLVGVAGLKSES